MYWNTRKLTVPCLVCGAPATVVVVDDTGEDVGPHCGPHADDRVNRENAPAFAALRASEAERLAAERAAADAA